MRLGEHQKMPNPTLPPETSTLTVVGSRFRAERKAERLQRCLPLRFTALRQRKGVPSARSDLVTQSHRVTKPRAGPSSSQMPRHSIARVYANVNERLGSAWYDYGEPHLISARGR